MTRTRLPRRQRGLTTVEIAVAAAIASVLASLAAPDFGKFTERRELEAAAALLETDVALARSEAVQRGASVRLDVQSGAAGSCYVVHNGPAGACDCLSAAAARCSAGTQPLRSVRYLRDARIALASNSASMLFDADVGTVTPTGTLRLDARGGDQVRQIVNIMGRVRSCSSTLPGYRPC